MTTQPAPTRRGYRIPLAVLLSVISALFVGTFGYAAALYAITNTHVTGATAAVRAVLGQDTTPDSLTGAAIICLVIALAASAGAIYIAARDRPAGRSPRTVR